MIMKRIALALFMSLLILTACAGPGLQTTQPTPVASEPPPTQPTPTEEAGEPGTVGPTQPPLEPAITPTEEPPAASGLIAYIGMDDNVWLLDVSSGERQPVTQDAVPWQPDSQRETISYCCAKWSSDGRWLAFRRDVLTPAEGGASFQSGLWVYEAPTGQVTGLVEEQEVLGFAWRPGTHLIAYGLPIPQEYFGPEGPSQQFAQGIWVIDAGTGNPYELVAAERGYAMVNPVWSPDGRFLSFEEVLYMEGRGQFALYDVEAEEYVAWDDAIGFHSWSPDGELIAYDRLTYIPTGSELIWLNNRDGSQERAFSEDYEPGYAFYPVFSPRGDMLAFLVGPEDLEGSVYNLIVQPLEAGEPRQLGVIEQAGDLSWSADGERLILTSGPYESRQLVEVNLADGSIRVLENGSQPAWQPVAP